MSRSNLQKLNEELGKYSSEDDELEEVQQINKLLKEISKPHKSIAIPKLMNRSRGDWQLEEIPLQTASRRPRCSSNSITTDEGHYTPPHPRVEASTINNDVLIDTQELDVEPADGLTAVRCTTESINEPKDDLEMELAYEKLDEALTAQMRQFAELNQRMLEKPKPSWSLIKVKLSYLPTPIQNLNEREKLRKEMSIVPRNIPLEPVDPYVPVPGSSSANCGHRLGKKKKFLKEINGVLMSVKINAHGRMSMKPWKPQQ